MLDARANEQGGRRRSAACRNWGTYVIGDTYSPANEGCQGRSGAPTSRPSAALPRSTPCSTSCSPTTAHRPVAQHRRRRRRDAGPCGPSVWSDPRAMVGGSDAGAHLDRMCGSSYPTAFLADCLRGRQLVPVERGRAHDDRPARGQLFGLARPRRRSPRACAADLFVFDPATVGSEPARLVHDLPGDAAASSPGRTASSGCWSTASRRSATGSRPGRSRHAAALRAATPHRSSPPAPGV